MSDSCISLLGWASSVLQLRTNHDLVDIPKLWAQLYCSNLTIYQQCYFLQDCIRKANGSAFAPQGYSFFADPKTARLHWRVPIPWFPKHSVPLHWLSKHFIYISLNYFTGAFDECSCEIIGSHATYATCIGWVQIIRGWGGLWSDPFKSTEFFGHETDNKPVTQCGNTDPIHSYNHPQNILHTVRISHM